MNNKRKFQGMACLVLVMFFLVGCGASRTTPTILPEAATLPESTEASSEPTEVIPVLTVIQVESNATEQPPQTGNENTTLTAQDVLAGTEQTEWDLIILGDSDMPVSPMYYSKYFEEDLGVKIVKQYISQNSTFSPVVQLKEDQELRETIAEAEIIVFNIPFILPDTGGACWDYNKKMEVDGCFDISTNEFAETTRNMIREIKALVGEKGAMIRLQNFYVPIKYFQDNIRLQERTQDCLECFTKYWEAQSEVAIDEGIPIVDVFTLFHGENYDQNPYENGYIASDRMHVNLVGAEAIANLYRDVGYEYWKP